MDDVTSRIVAACNGTEFFLASLVAIALIDKIGRRKLMLFGAVGQCLTMALLGILGAIDNSATQVVSAVLLFVFPTFFAIGWLGMTWLYVRLRISLVIIQMLTVCTARRDCWPPHSCTRQRVLYRK